MRPSTLAATTGLCVALCLGGYGHDAAAQLNPRGRPGAGTVTLRPGYLPDPHNVSVTSGGALSAQAVAGPACSGFITPEPSVVLVLAGLSPWFRVYVTSPANTTLVVRRPDGTVLCNDDTYGVNPSVEGVFPAGRYAIWVGALRAGDHAQATLSLTELTGNHP